MENRSLAPVWPRRDPLLASGLPAVALVHLLSGLSVPWCSPRRPAFLSFIPARSPRPTAAFQATALSHLWPVTPRGARLRDTLHTAPLTLGAEHGPSLLGLKRPSELRA